MDETSFRLPDTTEATSNLRLTQKVEGDRLDALLRHLNVTGNLDLINLNPFKLTTNPKKVAIIFQFYNGDRWVPLTKQTGEFFAPKTLRDRFGRIIAMKNFLGINTTPPSLERLISATSKLKSELPTDLQMESIPPIELLSLVEDIRVETREASQNTQLVMREYLGTNKTLQNKQGELLKTPQNQQRLINVSKETPKSWKK